MFCSAVKEKRSCNKNSIKNTEMLEKYIIAFPSKKLLFLESKISVLSIQPQDFSLKYTNRTENLIGGKNKS
jgi:hypothetical protein